MAPVGTIFYGNKIIAPGDYSIYYSYINQGAHGRVMMYDAFTSEAHRSTLFQPVWLVVGLGAGAFHLDAPTAFALARLVSIPILLLTLWWATGWLWPSNQRRRRLGFVFSIIASGLGGIATMVGPQLPNFPWTYPDLWVSEAYTMLTLWSSAHFILVTSGIIFILVAVERSWLEHRWSWAGWAAAVAAVTLSIHPFHILTWMILWIGLSGWRWITRRRFPREYVARWMLVLLAASPVLLLYGLQLLFDPMTIDRALQNINLTAVPWKQAIGLGLPLLSAVIGIWRWRIKDERWKWLVGIVVAYVAAAYFPVSFQRRLTQGMILPLIWLSVPILEQLLFFSRNTTTKFLTALATSVILSTSWLVVGGLVVKDYARDLQIPSRMYYIDPEHLQLAEYLRTTDVHQPLLGTLIESNVLAGLTAHQVYVGYGVETLRFADKLQAMGNFFTRWTEEQQRQLLQQERLCYILTSPRTRAYGSAFQPDQWPDLRSVWSSKNLALYQTSYCR